MLFFAQAREAANASHARIELADGSGVRAALDALERTHPGLAPLRAHLAIAVDGTLVRGEASLRDGAEMALLPPVSGG